MATLELRLPSGGKSGKVKVLINSQKGGSNTLLDEARMSPEQSPSVINLMQVQDGIWGTKWGTEYYGNPITGESGILGSDEFINASDVREIVAVGATTGKVYRSQDDCQTWTEVTGATMTLSKQCFFLQVDNELWITNATDRLTIYDGSHLTRNVQLNAPTGLSATRGAGLSAGSFTYYYTVVALNTVGFTNQSNEASVTVNITRDQFSSSANKTVSLSWTAVAGAERYEIYLNDESGAQIYLDSTTTNSYVDDGTKQLNIYQEAPSDNTTGGPILGKVVLSGNRVWGIDTANKQVVWGGTGQYLKYFSYFYGGGYAALEAGGRDTPIGVIHYRTGKGDAQATIYTSSPDGRGSIWQIGFDTVTIGSSDVVIPTPVKIVGSIGANSALSIVDAKDNIYSCNTKGVFSLQSKAQLFNVLSTEEQSVNIRPSYRNLSGSKFSELCAHYFEGKLFISGSEDGDHNDVTFLYDLEHNNWTWKWTIGFQQFFEHTDSGDKTWLMGVMSDTNQLVRISENVGTDLGQAFPTKWLSPIIHADPKDHTRFGTYLYGFVELGRPKGVINFEVIGTEKDRPFSSLGSRTITDTVSTIDFCNASWGDYEWGSDDDVPTTFSSATVKKAVKIRKKLNNIQFQVSSETANTSYTILSVGVTDKKPPSSWFN